MKKESTQGLEFIKKEWDTILHYERYHYQQRKNGQIPVNQLLNYFGSENICRIFGCSIVSTSIATALIKESFK